MHRKRAVGELHWNSDAYLHSCSSSSSSSVNEPTPRRLSNCAMLTNHEPAQPFGVALAYRFRPAQQSSADRRTLLRISRTLYSARDSSYSVDSTTPTNRQAFQYNVLFSFKKNISQVWANFQRINHFRLMPMVSLYVRWAYCPRRQCLAVWFFSIQLNSFLVCFVFVLFSLFI